MALPFLAALVLIPTSRATILDLSTHESSASAVAAMGGAYTVYQTDFATLFGTPSTGTGVIDPFLTIQRKKYERGYNTDATPTPLDAKRSGAPGDEGYTRSLAFSELPFVWVDGVRYVEFLLDINQDKNSSPSPLSLNQIQVFLSQTPMPGAGGFTLLEATATPARAAVISFADATEVFRMSDGDAQDEIVLNYALESGSGSGDMRLLLDDDIFAAGGKYVTLFSQFGKPPGDYESNAGFEEWSVRETIPPVPEPAGIFLFGTALLGIGWKLRRGITKS
ncbi:MAG: PEP-CTERM sorting domain-containing protein [Bryobacteraceae bacterium]